MAYLKEEKYDEATTAAIAEHYKEILRLLGEDPEREGLVKTPERVAKALQFLTHGSQQDGAEILRSAMLWDVMGGVARRSWARNENAMSTVSEFNDSHGNQGFSITEPFVADDAYIKSLINK